MNPYPARTASQQVMQNAPARPSARLLPFDQVVSLRLTGERDNIVRTVTNISVEGPFVASAIGYSLIAEPVSFRPEENIIVESQPPSAPVPPQALIRLESEENPTLHTGRIELFGTPLATVRLTVLLDGKVVPGGVVVDVKAKGKGKAAKAAPDEHKLPDSGHLVLNQPVFQGKSFKKGVVRVEDLDHDIIGSVVEFSPQTDESFLFGDRLPVIGRSRIDIKGAANKTVLVGTGTDLSQPGQGRQVTLDANGNATVTLDKPLSPGSTITIRKDNEGFIESQTMLTLPKELLNLNLALIPFEFLRRGFRVKRSLIWRLEKGVPPPTSELEEPFEPCGVSDLNFLYTITDQGSGRELQNEPIHNIAGLGIANGDRPFRTFPKPIVFRPRSVVQFEVREISGGPGTLFFVLQGYKVIGAGAQGGSYADVL